MKFESTQLTIDAAAAGDSCTRIYFSEELCRFDRCASKHGRQLPFREDRPARCPRQDSGRARSCTRGSPNADPAPQERAGPADDLIESLRRSAPETALVLFGSRARGTAKRYSDYDIGVYDPNGLGFPLFSRLLDLVGAWNDESLVVAQLVDLSRADVSFLRDAAEDFVFLAGSHTAWCDLLQKAGMQLCE